jgi:Carboxypeptidase regulatory-like domain
MKRSSIGILVLAFCISLLPLMAHAQVGNSGLSGVISDPSDAAIPNAQITLHGADESIVRTATTGGQGAYVIPTLPPGRYSLTVVAPGFESQQTQPFELSSGQTGSLNVKMKVAGQSTQVVVEDAPPLLQTTSESLGAVISEKEMASIPLLGRSFLNAISLAPGVVPVPPAGSTTNHSPVSQNVMPSVYGQRQKDNNFLMDGVENRDPNLLGVAIYPPPDAIKEMTIDSGVGSSAYGHASGATVDVVTKSGTSAWHGTAWEYWRNNILDARDYFQQTVGQYHQNQFGAEAGGPLAIPWLLSKDKKWYVYGYYEGVRITSPLNFTALIPTPAEISGDFTAPPSGIPVAIYNPFTTTASGVTYTRQQFQDGGVLNKIPASMLNPTAVALAKAIYPAPNLAPGVIANANYQNNEGVKTNGNQWDARVDHQFGERDTVFARYTGANNPVNSASLPTVPSTTSDKLLNVAASDTHVFSKSMVMTVRYGVTGVNYFTGNTFPSGLPQASGLGAVFPTFLGSQIIPPINISGYNGIPLNNATVGPVYQHSGIVDTQKILGKHNIEFGGSISHTHEVQDSLAGTGIGFTAKQTSNFNANGSPNTSIGAGDGFASFLLGVPDSANRQIGGAVVSLTTYGFGFYIQDTWRTGRLTLNGGLRYDYNAPPVNSYGLGTFYFQTGQYVFDQKNPITGAAPTIRPGGITPDRNNFAPRFGFAYQLTPRTVIRSSAGIFYDSFGSNYIQASQSAAGNWPFSTPQSASALNVTTVTAQLPNPFPGSPVGSTTTTGCSQCLNVDPASSRTPYVDEWTLSVQRQIRNDLGIEVAYFGSKGTKLTAQIVDNISPTPAPGSGPAANPNPRPFPQVSPYALNGYNEYGSSYNALAARVQRRYSHGLSFLLSYTYSKNIDYVDNLSSGNIYGQVTSNPTRYNYSITRGLAGFDERDVVSLSNVWDIPGRTRYHLVNAVIAGWAVSDIFSYRSGMPFSVFIGSDIENIGTVSGRSTEYPDQIGNPSVAKKTPGAWFNIKAFTNPASGVIGNVKRNPASLKSDHFVNDDMTVGKTWAIYAENSFELRGEFFNLFNHPNFGFPGQIVGNSNFGVVGSTQQPFGRTIQLAAKIHF